MVHKCERCGYSTNFIGNLKKHWKRKIPCNDVLQCNKSVSELLENNTISNQSRITQLQTSMKELQNELDILIIQQILESKSTISLCCTHSLNEDEKIHITLKFGPNEREYLFKNRESVRRLLSSVQSSLDFAFDKIQIENI